MAFAIILVSGLGHRGGGGGGAKGSQSRFVPVDTLESRTQARLPCFIADTTYTMTLFSVFLFFDMKYILCEGWMVQSKENILKMLNFIYQRLILDNDNIDNQYDLLLWESFISWSLIKEAW